jgi:hypothetical protein
VSRFVIAQIILFIWALKLMEVCQKRRGKMREWVETFANNLIGWIILFFDALRIRQRVTNYPEFGMAIPLEIERIAPTPVRSGQRSTRGPTSPHRRSDF